jgi:hypothetical protein
MGVPRIAKGEMCEKPVLRDEDDRAPVEPVLSARAVVRGVNTSCHRGLDIYCLNTRQLSLGHGSDPSCQWLADRAAIASSTFSPMGVLPVRMPPPRPLHPSHQNHVKDEENREGTPAVKSAISAVAAEAMVTRRRTTAQIPASETTAPGSPVKYASEILDPSGLSRLVCPRELAWRNPRLISPHREVKLCVNHIASSSRELAWRNPRFISHFLAGFASAGFHREASAMFQHYFASSAR